MKQNKIDVFSRMTDGMKEVLKIQEELAKDGFSTGADFKTLRKEYENERKYWNEGAVELTKIVDSTIEGPHGEIPVRFYYPNDNEQNDCAVFIHGGGFVIGSPNTHDRMIRLFAKHSNCVVVAIDYKLSPEYKFPVAIQECAALTKYLHENAKLHKINPNSISLVGDSGGANLSFATNLYLRENEKDTSYIKSLILYYGLFGLKDSVSRRTLGGPWDGLTREDLEYYESCYLNNKEESDNPYYDSLSADLSYGIPPVYMAAAELDPLLDDSIALEKMLKENNVKCELEIYKGVLHAFLHYTKILPEANEAIENGSAFLKQLNQ